MTCDMTTCCVAMGKGHDIIKLIMRGACIGAIDPRGVLLFTVSSTGNFQAVNLGLKIYIYIYIYENNVFISNGLCFKQIDFRTAMHTFYAVSRGKSNLNEFLSFLGFVRSVC